MKKTCNKCKIEMDITHFRKKGIRKKSNKIFYCSRCRKCLSEYEKVQRDKNKEKYKKWYNENRKERNIWRNLYYKKNKERLLKRNEKYKEKSKKYRLDRFKKDYLYKIKHILRCRLRSVLKFKSLSKNKKYNDIIGCSPEFLKEYLEQKFTEGMSWDNHGLYGWHIDHIIPLSSAKTEEEVYELCHYTNLQPLWADDNLKKSNKIIN